MNPTCSRVIAVLVFLGAGVCAQYDQCTEDTSSIANGWCDDINNNAECGYDGGDCCYCSCLDIASSCGEVAFDCRDPEYMGDEVSDCNGQLTVDAPCLTGTTQLVVNDTASATSLADEIRCSGGVFSVKWFGSVDVNRTIEVTSGTVLHVAGVPPGSVMRAASGIRLFTVINASLKLTDVAMAGGYATFGGAIAAARSDLSFENTSFTGNGAVLEGGALYATFGSIASFGEGIFFDGNDAGMKGGALAVGGSSSVTFHGYASFSNCTTDGYGGAFWAASSNVSWSGDAVFSDNTAGLLGGALHIFVSDVFWSGDAVFSNNFANGSGGALYLSSSNVSWSGDTVFSNNVADGSGGALYISSHTSSWDDTVFSNNVTYAHGGYKLFFASHVSWSCEAVFLNNVAYGSGGAISVSVAAVSWSGDFVFSNNTADFSGGALEVSTADVSWSGYTLFSNNVAYWRGGAMGVWNSKVSWSGDAVFLNNIAHVGGGALYFTSVDLSWSGDVVFSNNTTGGWGGALLVGSSGLSWSGDAMYSNNIASGAGGALSVSLADVSWSGDVVFSNNTASGAGGALEVGSSGLSWTGKVIFSNNTGRSGGALIVVSSDMSCAGKAIFSNNTAHWDGGASYISSSNVSWAGEVAFSNNTAVEWGGALSVVDSDVSWAGEVAFSTNMAGESGGALDVRSSNVCWTCKVIFFDNAANGDGGALYVRNGARVVFEMDLVLLRNSASGDGGAAFVYGNHDEPPSSFFVNSTAAFIENRCMGDGGALAVVVSGMVTFATTNATFSRNSAHTAGGAIAVKQSGVGPRFRGLTFMSNHAQVGGAAYITSSGTTASEDQYGALIQHATTFDQCMFISNEADATGGAIDTGAGIDEISNSYFASNTARAAGALRLAGITSLRNCSFSENTSENDEGSAIANVGLVSSITECSFVDNVFKCERGEFLDYHETNTVNGVFEVVCKGCGDCDDCTTSHRVPTCSKELEDTKSAGGNATIEALEINHGYWRATNTSRKVLKCYNADACLGGVTGASDYCDAGYEGPYCSTCLDGYSPSLGYTCKKCSGGAGSVAGVTIIIAISAILFVVLLLFCLMRGKSTGAGRGLLASWRRRLLSLKIIVIVWQITTQFTSLANVRYPDDYQRFLYRINIVNFDIGRIFSMECFVDIDFHHRLLISTMGPALALTVLGAMYAVHERINRPSYHDCVVAVREERHQKYVSMVLLLTFLVYSSVSSTLFQMFACDELDDGKSYLRADYRIDCNSPTHRSLQVYAAFMMVVYTAGIPVLYGIILFRNRQVLMDESTRQEDAAAKSISSLWKLYKPHRYYYELIECARRLLLAGVVVFFFPNTTAQVGIALMIAAFFMVLSEMVAPYESLWDAWINRIGHTIVFGTIYLAFLLKIDLSDEREESQQVFGMLLIAGQASMALFVMVEGFVVTYQWIKRSR